MMEKNSTEDPGGSRQLQENKMGIMPIPKLLFTMAVPAICSMTLQAVYNIVDSIFVAQISDRALTAVTLVFPIQMLVIAVGVGTGVGINSLIARRLGEKKFDEANSAATHGFVLAFVNWLVFLIFTIFFSRMFYNAFSDSSDLVDQAMAYSDIVTGVSIFLFLEMTCEKVLQATGNMVMPMISNMVGCVTNIILDPVLIFGYFGFPAMGVRGAAIATVIGQLLGMLVIAGFLFLREHPVKISLRKFRFSKPILMDIYSVGFPSMLMQAIPSFVTVFLNAILIAFSETAVSVLGVYFRIQSFVFMPVFGLNQGSTPIMGYNYGAKNRERLMQTLKLCLITAVIIMCIGVLIFQLFPGPIMSIFNPSADMLRMGTTAMRLLSLCFIPAAFGIVFATLFQALGFGTYSLIMTLLRQLIIILPAAWILSRFIGVTGVWLSYPIAECFSLLCALFFFRRIYRRQIQTIPLRAEVSLGKRN